MMNVKKAAIVGAVVATLVPALALARKSGKGRKVARKVVARTTAAARKVTHAPKARKSRSRRATASQKRGSQRVK